jgi:hypothetical protein
MTSTSFPQLVACQPRHGSSRSPPGVIHVETPGDVYVRFVVIADEQENES